MASERHFRTDDLGPDVERRAARGGVVTVAAQGLALALELGSIAALARLLDPSDFGMVAMIRALTGLVAMFGEAGLSTATVQREEIDHVRVSTLFWVNAAVGALLALAVAGASPLIAWIYGEPDLIAPTIALSGTFVLGGLAVQHTALLKRRMEFRALAVQRVLALALGVATSIVMARAGHGYWALVGLALVTAAGQMMLAWLLSGWVPGRPGRLADVSAMLAYGGFLSGSQFLAYVRRNLDDVLIGVVWGAQALGVYNVAYRMILAPIQQINTPIGYVMLPALSRLRASPERYRLLYRDALQAVASLGLPLVVAMLLFPREIIRLVLGEAWLGAVPIFVALGPAAVAGVLNIAAAWVFASTGRTREQFRANVFLTLGIGGAIVAAAPYGPEAVAWAFSFAFCVSRWPHFRYAFRESPVSLGDLGVAVWRPVASSAVGVAAVVVVRQLIPPEVDPVWQTRFGVATFAIVVALTSASGVFGLVRRSWVLGRA